MVIQAIIENKGVPAGFCADRPLLMGMDQIYSHNFFSELLLTFGYILGGVLVLSLLILIVRAIKCVKNIEEFSFGTILFCCSIIKLQVSGTFLSEPMLYLFIGYCVSLIRKNKYIYDKSKCDGYVI